MTTGRIYLGITTGPGDYDPCVAAVRDGRVVAYAEEERLVRTKHAIGQYPRRALRYCLEATGVRLDQVAAVSVNYNLAAYSDGRMRDFFAAMAEEWSLDEATTAWQRGCLQQFDVDAMEAFHRYHWRRDYGDIAFPPLRHAPHHFTHAFQAAMESPFDNAVVLTVDGSGDADTTVLWLLREDRLEPLRTIRMPHSLGWFYAAFTEYLGFAAYDGEYKVMGLAAYGTADADLRETVGQVLLPASDGVEFRLDPTYIHYGDHTYSGRFTDKLVKLLGLPRRLPDGAITRWHKDLAFEVQHALEEAVCRLVRWAVDETGVHQVCIGGGVGHNVKMNSRIFELPEVSDVFAHPLCTDSGAAAGAALVTCHEDTGVLPPPLTSLALGPAEDADTTAALLRNAGIPFTPSPNVCAEIAGDLAAGRIVGWFEGRMEAGPRALGQRSILADPRRIEIRDRVNAAIKQREPWRPFGPSMPAHVAGRYFDQVTDSRYMTLAFRANDALRRDAPAIVHVDGSSRAQFVHEDVHPVYHRLLTEFEKLTGVPVLLNTSFNVRGEPIVCTAEDALRTFWSTGLDVLVIGDLVVRKENTDV